MQAWRSGSSRTIRTVRELRGRDPSLALRLLVGSDVLREKDSWERWDELTALAPIFLLGRAGALDVGVETPKGVLPEVSSSEIRERLRKASRPCSSDSALAAVVPRDVLAYVDEQGLYR